MEKSKLSFALHLATRYWFVFLVVAAVNALIRIFGIPLFNYSVLDWVLPALFCVVYVFVLAKIDKNNLMALRGLRTSLVVTKCLIGLVWASSAALAGMSALSFFGVMVCTDVCDKKMNRNECRAYETVLESRNGPIKQVLFDGWAWKPCVRCFDRGEINAPDLSFENAVIKHDDGETVLADVSVKTMLSDYDVFWAQLIKNEPVHTQDAMDSMVSERAFACLKSVEGWRFPKQISSVEVACDSRPVPFWSGRVAVKNIRIGAD
jgi:hypothetical protein